MASLSTPSPSEEQKKDTKKAQAREAKRAAALRANLRRRKAKNPVLPSPSPAAPKDKGEKQ